MPAPLAAPVESRVFIVQFGASPGPVERDALESRGITILRYVPDHAYVVRAPLGLDPGTVPGVRWAGPYHAAYKLDESLLAGALMPDHGAPAPVRCGIELLEAGLEAQWRLDAALRAMGSRLEFFSPDGFRVEAALTPAQLLAAARHDDVSFIDPDGPPGADMDIARQLSGAVFVQPFAAGEGVRGEVFDTDLAACLLAFQDPPAIAHGEFGQVSTTHSHGCAVFAIVFGNDPAQPLIPGMLPAHEQGIFSQYTRITTFGGTVTLLQHLQELVDPLGPYRGVFWSSQVGSPPTSTYTTISAQMDHALLHVDLAATQSLSPLGVNARPEGWAKNVISVGDIKHQNTLTRSDDTGGIGGGPAADGRVKPDFAHITDGVQVQTWTEPFGGTSAATPIIAGGVGLLCQLWHEGAWTGFGGGPTVFDDRPHASTIRALTVNTAYQYDWTVGGPNASITRANQGWGMPDLQSLYQRRTSTFIIDESDVLLPQGVNSYTLVVEPGQGAFKATMVYVDPPGSPAVQSQHRVNDLTLKATSPSGVVYWGNQGLGAGIWSQPGGAPDTKNTVENIFVQNPEAGDWVVQVSAPELVMDAHLATPAIDADYALAVSGVQIEQPCYADCNNSGALSIADFTCFQMKFVAGNPYADCNNSGTLTVGDFTCFQAAFVAGCP